jgi:hypothetical protein
MEGIDDEEKSTTTTTTREREREREREMFQQQQCHTYPGHYFDDAEEQQSEMGFARKSLDSQVLLHNPVRQIYCQFLVAQPFQLLAFLHHP